MSGMYWKQGLTLACAVGLVLTGACFVPTRSDYRPPPVPPLAPGTLVRVLVTNGSQSRLVEPVRFAEVLADDLRRQDKLAARPGQAEGSNQGGEAQWRVEIRDEKLTGTLNRKLRLRVAMTFVDADGRNLRRYEGWVESVALYRTEAQRKAEDSEPQVLKLFTDDLGWKLVSALNAAD